MVNKIGEAGPVNFGFNDEASAERVLTGMREHWLQETAQRLTTLMRIPDVHPFMPGHELPVTAQPTVDPYRPKSKSEYLGADNPYNPSLGGYDF